MVRNSQNQDQELTKSLLEGEDRVEQLSEDGVQTHKKQVVQYGKNKFVFEDFIRSILESVFSVLEAIGSWCSRLFRFGAEAEEELTDAQFQKIQFLRKLLQTDFDPENQEHQEQLRKLWEAGFPGVEYGGIKNPKWKEMGWQGEDPSTDFRGAGMLGLYNLLYFADNSPNTFMILLNKSDGVRSEWEYPFGAAGINVTFSLVEMFNLRNREKNPSKVFLNLMLEQPDIFEEVYCIAMKILDEIWLEAKATYMDFPHILKQTKQRVQEAFDKKPRNMNELRKLLQK
eukprot:TRINITY_DN1121_c2_g3_i1.p1 TRINITY_DN1121_c2_g3~~TRINITY_DN1121_c2_g3_i1.p1  ORF type:complete len:305 (+),score=42.59 TRINITY_DN1121_c2_g3_i1:62-916(+)